MSKKGQKIEKKLRVTSDVFDGNYWEIFDLMFFGRDKSELLKYLEREIEEGREKIWVTTVNPEFIMKMDQDKAFAEVINKSNIKTADGIGLIWAREVLKYPKGIKRLIAAWRMGVKILEGKERNNLISGADLMFDMAKGKRKIFLLGGFGRRAEKSAKYLEKINPKVKIGWCQGDPEIKNSEVITRINKFQPDYLLVAYGMKKQEEWIEKNLDKLKVKVVMGVGRSFDYYSGELKRAPKWVRKMGLEWLYSLIKEPKRWRRQLALPKFVWKVLIN